MTVTLAAPVGPGDSFLPLAGGPLPASPPCVIQIGTEYMLVTSSSATTCEVVRGFQGSGRSAHAQGVTVYPVVPSVQTGAPASPPNTGGVGSTPPLADVLAVGADANALNITGLADPVDDQDAATKKYVDDNAGGGGIAQGGPLTEDLDADGNTITGLVDPTSAQDAATKKYVDDNAGGGGGLGASVGIFAKTAPGGGYDITTPLHDITARLVATADGTVSGSVGVTVVTAFGVNVLHNGVLEGDQLVASATGALSLVPFDVNKGDTVWLSISNGGEGTTDGTGSLDIDAGGWC